MNPDDVAILILALLLGLIPAVIAHRKGGNFFLWWLYGATVFIVALPSALLKKANTKAIESRKLGSGDSRACPSCAEIIKRGAVVCRYCGRDVPVTTVPVTAAPDQSVLVAVPKDPETPPTLQASPKATSPSKSYTQIGGAIGLLVAVLFMTAWHNRYSLPFFKFDPIQTVCQGELDGHEGAIGTVFNAAFQNPHWTVLTAPDGGTEVQFDGAVQYGRAQAFLDADTSRVFLNSARPRCVISLNLSDPLTAVFKQALDLTHAYGIDADPNHVFQAEYYANINPDPEFLRQLAILRATSHNYADQISRCVDTQTLPTKIDFIFSSNKETFFLADGPAFNSAPFTSFESMKAYIYK